MALVDGSFCHVLQIFSLEFNKEQIEFLSGWK